LWLSALAFDGADVFLLPGLNPRIAPHFSPHTDFSRRYPCSSNPCTYGGHALPLEFHAAAYPYVITSFSKGFCLLRFEAELRLPSPLHPAAATLCTSPPLFSFQCWSFGD
jgi:hypothetical protein